MKGLGAPAHPRCEYFINPLGIDSLRPRLSWLVNDDRRSAVQSACHLLVSSSPELLAQDRGDLWDSGKVTTDQSTHVEYAGAAMKSRARAFWKVRTFDAEGKASPWSDTARWEVGLAARSDWTAKWIGSTLVGGPYTIPPCPYLRRGFDLSKPVASARLYATALGLYEFEINGKRVGDYHFTPGRTEYEKRVPYHTYDVTPLLQAGANACGAILGDGWYVGHLHSDPRQRYGDRPKLFAQLEITFQDGSRQTIVTDESWRAGEGPIRSSDMLMGEDYDARLEIPGWSAPGFDDSHWHKAVVFDDPGIDIVAHRAPPIRVIQEITPVGMPVVSANKRRRIYDLGQNMVGRVRLKIRNAPPGRTIDLRFVEMLDKNGKPYTEALRSARSTDHYTTRGGAEEIFESRFTFHGFRYVEVRDVPGEPTIDAVTGIVMHSDTPPTGTFECSDPMINKLQSNIVWSQKGNFFDIPTDCPQRDERLGWTGDAQVFIRTAAFNMDVANFFHKWLQDMADTQALHGDGRIHSVIPGVKTIHHEGGPAWADAAIICPWIVYLCYGDKRILEDRWEMMRWFIEFLEKTCPGHVRADESCKWRGYGDWLNQDAPTPNDLIGIAFYSYCARLLANVATILGRESEASRLAGLADAVRDVWMKRYVTPDGLIIGQTQTAYVLALHFDLLPEPQRPAIVEALVRNIKSRGVHLSTGFVGTPYLNPVLTRFGHNDLAYQLLQQKTFPSWLFPVTHGATTMWERWDGWTPEKGFNDAGMNSYNHYAYGAVGEWMYACVAGIELDPKSPGYKHILIRPQIPSPDLVNRGGGLTHASASLMSMYGRIESKWKMEGDTLRLSVMIPPNTTATIRVPTIEPAGVREGLTAAAESAGLTPVANAERYAAVFTAGAGRYEFTAKIR